MIENQQNTDPIKTQQKRIGLWASGIFSVLGLAFSLFWLYNVLFLQKGHVDLSDKILLPVTVLMLVAGVAGYLLIQRDRIVAGLWVIFVGAALIPPVFATLVLNNIYIISISYLVVFTFISITWVFPRSSRRMAIFATVGSLLVIVGIEFWHPTFRLGSTALQNFAPYVIALGGLSLLAFAIQRAITGNIRVKIITAFTVVALVSLGILGTVTYINFRNQVREDIRQRLLNIISITALQQDGDLFATIQTTEDMKSEAYQKMQAVNAAILATDRDLAYIFSVRMDDQGKMVFVIDSGLEEGYVPLEVGVVYDDPSALLAENALTLDHSIVEKDFYTDEYGTFLSAYAPIYKDDGTRAGIVGVDIFADKVIAQERNVLYLILGTTAIAMVFVTLLGLFLGNVFTKPIISLSHIAQKITQGDLSTRAEVETTDEVGDLAKAFNTMTSQLQGTLQGLEQRVAARTRDLEIVAEVGTATATILESRRLLQEVVDLTKERFNLYHSHIYLLDEKGENLVLTAGAGEPGRIMVTEGRSIPLSREQSLVARAARERKGVTVNDVTQAPDFLPNPLLPDTRSELAVPMIVGGNVIGVFDIQSEQVGRFTDSDVNIQTTLAAQLATSIQNVRSFEKSRKQAEFESLANVIGQKIQRSTSIEETLQTAIRELGTALGASRVKANIAVQKDGNNN